MTGAQMAIDDAGWCLQARPIASPNFDDRPAGLPIDLLVIHSISLPPGQFGGEAITQLFTNTLDPAAHPYFETIAALRVSSHFLIRRDGELIQYVSTRHRAWHAGISRFRDRERCNDFSVGVELEGLEGEAFEAAQYATLVSLSRALIDRHPIRWAAAHSEIAPGRKQDPGGKFDWAVLIAGCPQLLRGDDESGL